MAIPQALTTQGRMAISVPMLHEHFWVYYEHTHDSVFHLEIRTDDGTTFTKDRSLDVEGDEVNDAFHQAVAQVALHDYLDHPGSWHRA